MIRTVEGWRRSGAWLFVSAAVAVYGVTGHGGQGSQLEGGWTLEAAVQPAAAAAGVHVCVDRRLPAESTIPRLSGAALCAKRWQEATIRVSFLNGSAKLQSEVKKYARPWTIPAGAAVRFQFMTSMTQGADIRIGFAHDNRSWSNIGTDARQVPFPAETMHYGWFEDATPEEEFRRTIEHEFGHALGLVHEHQSPGANIQWCKPCVYAWYKDNEGWNQEEVDQNIFARYATTNTQFTTFDKSSIMLYPIPKEFTTDGFSVGWNTVITPTDLAFVHNFYGSRGHRNDGCP